MDETDELMEHNPLDAYDHSDLNIDEPNHKDVEDEDEDEDGLEKEWDDEYCPDCGELAEDCTCEEE